MKAIIIFTTLLLSLVGHSQKLKEGDIITVTSWVWDCGGYSPEKAKVVRVKKVLYICYLGDKFFDLDENGKSIQCKPLKKALAIWKEDETKIVKIKHSKPKQ